MIFIHIDTVCKSVLYVILFVWAIVGYTYFVNLRRKVDDPKKQNYHPFAIFLAPITLPFFLFLAILALLLTALLFAVFLIVFIVLLITFRKPFIFIWWDKFATSIGDPLLRVNTYLVKMAFRPWNPNPQPAYQNFPSD